MFRSLLIALGLAVFAAASSPPADAQVRVKRVNVLVVSDDADQETVPRQNRIYNRVVLGLQEELNTRGFQVYDEVGTTLATMPQGRVRRTDGELYEVARAIQPPMDVIAVFQIYTSIRSGSVVSRPEIRIPVRLLNVRTGQLIGTFEVGPGITFDPLPVNCSDRECLLERVGDEARRLSSDVARELGTKLEGFIGAAAPPAVATAPAQPAAAAPAQQVAALEGCDGLPTAFMLVLRDFTSDEISRIEEMVRAFRCVEHIRPTRVSNSQSDYWIEARTDNARLNRNLRQMVEFMGSRGNVTFSGNRFEVIKTVTR